MCHRNGERCGPLIAARGLQTGEVVLPVCDTEVLLSYNLDLSVLQFETYSTRTQYIRVLPSTLHGTVTVLRSHSIVHGTVPFYSR